MAVTTYSPSESQSLIAAQEATESYLQSRLKATTSTSTTSFRSIPIIDLSSTYNTSSFAERQATARQIYDACTTVGFFYITGHGLEKTCKETLKLAERFFHELPQEEKNAIHVKHSECFYGYEPADFSLVSHVTAKETKDAYTFGYEARLDPTGGDGKYVELDGSKGGGKNQWPDEASLPGFYEGIADYYGQTLQLCRHMFRLFALSLNLPEDYFEPLTTHPGGIVRLMRYPPSKDPKPLSELNKGEEETGLGAHTDYKCFTLLIQDENPGLEILSPDGHWVSAPPVEGSIVVNVADFLMRWTNGLYKSTVHRAVNRTGNERISVPLFFSINYDEIVETLPSCVSEDNPSRFPPITAGRYVLDRVALTVKNLK